MKRLFFGIPAAKDTHQAIVHLTQELKHLKGTEHVKWVAPRNYHVTLHFLGPTPADKIPALIDAINQIKPNGPVELIWKKILPFPKSHPFALVIYAQLTESLAKLTQQICTTSETLTLPGRKHAYLPHLTLGRDRKHLIHLDTKNFKVTLPEKQLVTEFVLYESELTPNGSIYTVLEKFEL